MAFKPSELLADKLDDGKLQVGDNILAFISKDKAREIPRREEEAYEVVIKKSEVFSKFHRSDSSEKEIDPNILNYVQASLEEFGWETVTIDTDSKKIRVELTFFNHLNLEFHGRCFEHRPLLLPTHICFILIFVLKLKQFSRVKSILYIVGGER